MYLFESVRRTLLVHAAAATIAAFVTLCAFIALVGYRKEQAAKAPPQQLYALPPEVICLAPYAANHKVPTAYQSKRPIVRLREYAPNRYELLYWGNPVRPQYGFSVTALATRTPSLISDDNRPLPMQPLPVTKARRSDGKLPLQPVVRLSKLKGRTGDLYAARVAVHDAKRGTVLCSEVYLISGTE